MQPPTIAFIGAGSTVFAKNLLGDIPGFPELSNAHVRLHDVDAARLATTEVVARRIAAATHARPSRIATTDREQTLDGADDVISVIQVGGCRPATVAGVEVPKRYGLRHGDWIAPALRARARATA